MRHRRLLLLVSAVLAISACSLYTGGTEHTPHITAPDAGTTDHDGGCGGGGPDGGSYDNDGGSYGGNDGGIYDNDGGSYGGNDGGGYGGPDGGVLLPDAH